jgi:glycosyltransferase involved in cell wall biosynthesis
LRRARRFAKYAEQWTPFPDEPVGYRIQRWVYGSRLFGAPVQVYIPPDRQGKNLVPFFPSVIGREQWDRYSGIATTRTYVSPFRLLFAGRLVSGKGVDIAVQALRHVLDKNFDVVLDIVGDGPERTATERLVNSLGIADRTRFYGWVGWSDLERLYARAHVFVHCSRKEGFGKVIVEAMAFGLPVVATDVGLCRWILDPPMCGLVVPPDNPEEIAHAVCRILSNPEEARAMGLRGRERSAQWLLESLEDHYRTFLKKHLALPM